MDHDVRDASSGSGALPAKGVDEMSGRRLRERLDELATLSDDPAALTRLYLSPAHRRAAALVRSWMEAAGMAATVDAVGTVVGRYEAAEAGRPALLLGSHIDTVRNAGRFDGTLGVVTAIAVVAELSRQGRRLPFAIEILAFGDEEGVRFPATLSGSRAIAGTFDPSFLNGRDADGTTLGEALEGFGCRPAEIALAARRREDVLGYIEIHIEQACELEERNLPVGLVAGISGAMRFTLEMTGASGHAGTLPMERRADALCGAAAIVLAIEEAARATPGLFATVGHIEALPGAVNVVPGKARLTLDLRAFDDALRATAVRAILVQAEAIAAARGLVLSHRLDYDQATTHSDPALLAHLREAVEGRQLRAVELASGAGHDGLAVAALCPIAMLFVRCRGGVSHHPAEEVADADMETAARILLDAILRKASSLDRVEGPASRVAGGRRDRLETRSVNPSKSNGSEER